MIPPSTETEKHMSEFIHNKTFDIPAIDEMSVEELEIVSGGWRTQKIHMDYHDVNKMNDPTAVRYA